MTPWLSARSVRLAGYVESLKAEANWTRPSREAGAKVVFRANKVLAIAIVSGVLIIDKSAPIPTTDVHHAIIYRVLVGASLAVMLGLLLDLLSYTPNYIVLIRDPDGANFFNEFRQLYRSQQIPLDELAIQPPNRSNQVEVTNVYESLLGTTRDKMRLHRLWLLSFARSLVRVVGVIAMLTVLAVGLNTLTGSAVVSHASSGGSLVSPNLFDYVTFSVNYVLTASSPFVVQSGGWGALYTVVNALTVIGMGSFVLVTVNSHIANSGRMLEKVCRTYVESLATASPPMGEAL
jgi:hypothetical protein